MQHPPWYQMAEEILKAEAPDLYRELREAGELDAHLRIRAEHARSTYEALVKRLDERHPGKGSFVLQSAQESVIRDVLRYTT